MAKIRNKITGEIREVPDTDLVKYGIAPQPDRASSFGEKITSGANVVTDFLFPRTKKFITEDLPEYYKKGAPKSYKERLQRTAEIAPKSIAVGGELGAWAMPATKTAKGASFLQKVGAGAKTGARIGGVMGATEEADSLGERAKNTFMSSLVGGGFGGATTAGTAAVTKAGKSVIKKAGESAPRYIRRLFRPSAPNVTKFKRNTGMNFEDEILKRDGDKIAGMDYDELSRYMDNKLKQAGKKLENTLAAQETKTAKTSAKATKGVGGEVKYKPWDARATTKDIENYTVKKFGTQSAPQDSLYITTDGKFLGNKGMSGSEHVNYASEILQQGFNSSEDLAISSGMVEMAYIPGKEVNFRIYGAPTGQQLQMMRKVSSKVPTTFIEIGDKGGRIIISINNSLPLGGSPLALDEFFRKYNTTLSQPPATKGVGGESEGSGVARKWLIEQINEIARKLKPKEGNVGTSSTLAELNRIKKDLRKNPDFLTGSQANNIKRQLQNAGKAAYSPTGSPTPSSKAFASVASRLRKEIERLYPETKEINKEIQLYRLAKDSIQRRTENEANKMTSGFLEKLIRALPVGLGTGVGIATGNPVAGVGTAGTMVGMSTLLEKVRSPQSQTKIAATLSRLAKKATTEPEKQEIKTVIETLRRLGIIKTSSLDF